jgi:uncharacterized protein (DUF885 family)
MALLARGTSLILTLALVWSLAACGPSGAPDPSATGTPDADFRKLAAEYLDFTYRQDPSFATYLGIHSYDDLIADRSAAAIRAADETSTGFRTRLAAIDADRLSADARLDYGQLTSTIDSALLYDNVIRGWAKDPDSYSSGITNDAYVMISRAFAPPEQRLAALTKRLELMPGVLAEARKNLDNPPRIYTEIAIEQIDGNRDFFVSDVPAAFADVTDPALLEPFRTANAAVIAALDDYRVWMQNDLLPRSGGSFAYGADTYQRVLAADEMITTPLAELLSIAEADLARNQQAFTDTARQIDPTKSPVAVLDDLKRDHPPAAELLDVTQRGLDSLAQFIRDHQIADIPDAAPARVIETPPFLRATTSATMDIPGPFEKVADEAYFTMTLPDPSWPPREQDDFMTQWYRPAISNTSVHEVWPGHYLQFLYAKDFPSDVRKVFSTSSNTEGWAHYCEQMMLDEGLHADDPRYRLSQLQDALRRDVRFIVGIGMHTQGMTVEQAAAMFVEKAYQPPAVAESEAKRGTSDATYGYYTMGKLMILKLRDDYRAKMGDAYSLRAFHDAFVKLGPLPLPLIRTAMLGDVGDLF